MRKKHQTLLEDTENKMTIYNTNPNCQDLIKSGTCKADCCGPVPLLANYWRILKQYAQTKEYEITKVKDRFGDVVVAITKSGNCVFLKQDYSCAIYKSHLRPEICSMFGNNSNEPLLACKHINPDKVSLIDNAANDLLDDYKKIAGMVG